MQFSDRDQDYRNHQKAYYYNEKQEQSKPYWTRDKNYYDEMRRPHKDDTVKVIMTQNELEKLIFSQVMNAQEHLLNIIMNRFRILTKNQEEIKQAEGTIFSLVNQIVGDNREIYKQLNELKKEIN
ncbi:hypothetical protein NIE88_12665 [Sporolactobacillus shoreicorticis]|uniref:Replication protein n=1 Tax=Sporolactobacillus shoreicorticis TaxID=1923877 RepID=A0ABW5S6B7_9BACL|nr:hypothetical protein [Sporolactobacillus shoreicorticis]MCO7126617.1 hypothetical protein [Sporolactobacillus shoreicorticis]